MKKFFVLLSFLLLASLPAFSAMPRVNGVDVTRPVDVISIINSNLSFISPAGGNNGLSDMLTNTPSRIGQLGVSQDSANGGGDIFLWGAGAVALGSNGWGRPLNFPAFHSAGAAFPYASPLANVTSPEIRVNGSRGFMSRTNIVLSGALSDCSLVYRQYNPYGHATMYFPQYTTDPGYARGGNTNTALVGYTTDNVAVYLMDAFGLTVGTIHPQWPLGETNQAGAMVLILGERNDTPFHISGNHNLGGGDGVSQVPFFTINRQGFTNPAMPIAVGFPMKALHAWEPTNGLFRWALVVDWNTGKVYATNNTLTVTNLLSTSTNAGANIFGGNYDSTAVNNFNGSASFNAATELGFNIAWTFDAAGSHRAGFIVRAGNYPAVGHGAGSPLRFGRSSLSDMLNPAGTVTEEMQLDANGQLGIGTTTPAALLDVNGTIRTRLTPSAVVVTDSSSNLASIANGTGMLTNNGSGVLGWLAFPFALNAWANAISNYVTSATNSPLGTNWINSRQPASDLLTNIANTTKTATTVSGAGSGSTNYLMTLSTNAINFFYFGSSNINLYTIAGSTLGSPIRWDAIITNLSANTWGIRFDQGTNRFRFRSDGTGTNAPTVLTNGTAFHLQGISDGTNTLVKWTTYQPGI